MLEINQRAVPNKFAIVVGDLTLFEYRNASDAAALALRRVAEAATPDDPRFSGSPERAGEVSPEGNTGRLAFTERACGERLPEAGMLGLARLQIRLNCCSFDRVLGILASRACENGFPGGWNCGLVYKSPSR